MPRISVTALQDESSACSSEHCGQLRRETKVRARVAKTNAFRQETDSVRTSENYVIGGKGPRIYTTWRHERSFFAHHRQWVTWAVVAASCEVEKRLCMRCGIRFTTTMFTYRERCTQEQKKVLFLVRRHAVACSCVVVVVMAVVRVCLFGVGVGGGEPTCSRTDVQSCKPQFLVQL